VPQQKLFYGVSFLNKPIERDLHSLKQDCNNSSRIGLVHLESNEILRRLPVVDQYSRELAKQLNREPLSMVIIPNGKYQFYQ
jgi:hypothetical protein